MQRNNYEIHNPSQTQEKLWVFRTASPRGTWEFLSWLSDNETRLQERIGDAGLGWVTADVTAIGTTVFLRLRLTGLEMCQGWLRSAADGRWQELQGELIAWVEEQAEVACIQPQPQRRPVLRGGAAAAPRARTPRPGVQAPGTRRHGGRQGRDEADLGGQRTGCCRRPRRRLAKRFAWRAGCRLQSARCLNVRCLNVRYQSARRPSARCRCRGGRFGGLKPGLGCR